ncbi:integrator complex subunit 3 [Anaeramoeba ignava]|uniref:Integrator complex subunit 3 n=1 Tax=Anaeramoeba ignava TaxID=1746090 RepID=A0A9Q0LKC0_ANAIG|nr:integrator complex subunit 3 [Anaeramoeba ignava]
MQESQQQQNKITLFVKQPLDADDEYEKKSKEDFELIQKELRNKTETERASIFQSKVFGGTESEKQVVNVLLYGILTSQSAFKENFTLLTSLTRDQFSICISSIQFIIFEKYYKLHPHCKMQLLLLVKELVMIEAKDSELLVLELLRQIIGSDLSDTNLWLIQSLLEILTECPKTWLFNYEMLIYISCYTFLRLISDHIGVKELSQIQNKEINYTLMLLKEKTDVCFSIGRDLIRLLQNLNSIPEFKPIWDLLLLTKEEYYNLDSKKKEEIFLKYIKEPNNENLLPNKSVPIPKELSSGQTMLEKILNTRTKKICFQSRLTPKIETQLLFMVQKIKMGMQRRHQQWFFTQHLSSDPLPNKQIKLKEGLIIDLIRYVCCAYHPLPETVYAGFLTRWATIGWLLKSIHSSKIQHQAKIALFYDWLFFDPSQEIIMDIEPALLLMIFSIPKYFDITSQLMDFLCDFGIFYEPNESIKIHTKQSIIEAFKQSLDKRVISFIQFEQLFSSEVLHDSLKSKFKNIFGSVLNSSQDEKQNQQKINPMELENDNSKSRKRGLKEIISNSKTKEKKHNMEKNHQENLTETISTFREKFSKIIDNFPSLNEKTKSKEIHHLITDFFRVSKKKFLSSEANQANQELVFQFIFNTIASCKLLSYQKITHLFLSLIFSYEKDNGTLKNLIQNFRRIDKKFGARILLFILSEKSMLPKISFYFGENSSEQSYSLLFYDFKFAGQQDPDLLFQVFVACLTSKQTQITNKIIGQFEMIFLIVQFLDPKLQFEIQKLLLLTKIKIFGTKQKNLIQIFEKSIELLNSYEQNILWNFFQAEFSNQISKIENVCLILLDYISLKTEKKIEELKKKMEKSNEILRKFMDIDSLENNENQNEDEKEKEKEKDKDKDNEKEKENENENENEKYSLLELNNSLQIESSSFEFYHEILNQIRILLSRISPSQKLIITLMSFPISSNEDAINSFTNSVLYQWNIHQEHSKQLKNFIENILKPNSHEFGNLKKTVKDRTKIWKENFFKEEQNQNY